MEPVCCCLCILLLLVGGYFAVQMVSATPNAHMYPSSNGNARPGGGLRASSGLKPSHSVLDSVDLLNKYRAKGATCPGGDYFPPNNVHLHFDCRLFEAAQLHSEDMAHQGYFGHVSKDGRTPQDRVRGLYVTGENIATGQSSPQSVLEDWLKSDDHCKNMFNPDHTLVGVGYSGDTFHAGSRMWTEMFADNGVAEQACLFSGGGQVRSRKNTAGQNAVYGSSNGAPPGGYKFHVTSDHIV